MDDQNRSSNVPHTTITLDRLPSRQKEAKGDGAEQQRRREEDNKHARKPSSGVGFSRLFRRSPSRGKDDKTNEAGSGPSSTGAKKPVGLSVGTQDANRLMPESARDLERPPSAQSHRSAGSGPGSGSGGLLSPRVLSDERPPRSPRTPKSPSLWERPTRSREGDAGFGED